MSLAVPLLIVALLGPVAGGCLGMKYSAAVAKCGIGLVFGLVVFGADAWALAGVPVLYLGESVGIGHPRGFAIRWHRYGLDAARHSHRYLPLEWWQPEALRYRPYLSLALRGALFGIPTFIYGLPLAMWLGCKLTPLKGITLAKQRKASVPRDLFLRIGPWRLKMNEWRWAELLQYPLALAPLILIT